MNDLPWSGMLASIGAGVAGVAGVAGMRTLSKWALPADPLPRPTGPNGVATTVTVLDDQRRLPVQLWYPADVGDGHPAPLFPDAEGAARAIAAVYPFPVRLLNGLSRLYGHATADAPHATDVTIRGVVVISHGWLGFRTIHVDLAEQLASEGWVVLAVDHIGGALLTQYPDGATVGLEPALMPPDGVPDHQRRTEALVTRYAEDIRAVLDALSGPELGWLLPPTTPISAPVWLVGHSTGGGAAVQVAATTSRIAGVLGLDPWVEPVPQALRDAVDVPIVAIRSGVWVGNPNDALLRAMTTVQMRAVDQAGHIDLTALAYLAPITRLVGLTRCDPGLAHAATLSAFADLTGAAAVVGSASI